MSVYSAFGEAVLRAHEEGRLDDAEELLRDALERARGAGDRRRVVQALRALADVAVRREDEDAAADFYVEAVAVARTAGDDLLLAHTVRHQGDGMRRVGRLAEARIRYDEALSLYRSAPDAPRLDLANAVRPMALLMEALREPRAAALWAEARDLYAAVGVVAGVDEAEAALTRIGSDEERR